MEKGLGSSVRCKYTQGKEERTHSDRCALCSSQCEMHYPLTPSSNHHLSPIVARRERICQTMREGTYRQMIEGPNYR